MRDALSESDLALFGRLVSVWAKRLGGRTTTIFVSTRRKGAHTAHTQVGRPTHEAPTREYTHKHT